MGLYNSICSQCSRPFVWFSGSRDLRCDNCKFSKDNKIEVMDYTQAHLDSLNKVISVQTEFIAFLKSEIERLKIPSISFNSPLTAPNCPPFTQHPSWPANPPLSPYQPITEPFVVTCADGTSPCEVRLYDGGSTVGKNTIFPTNITLTGDCVATTTISTPNIGNILVSNWSDGKHKKKK